MGSDVAALVQPELIIDPENEAIVANRRSYPMDLVAGVIGGHQVFPAILDPFHRTLEGHRSGSNEDIFWVELAAYAEPATHVPFMQVHLILGKTEHRGDRIPVVVGQLGSAIHPESA
jgi:hypothetical protein